MKEYQNFFSISRRSFCTAALFAATYLPAQTYKELPKMDLNGDGEKETVFYQVKQDPTLNAKNPKQALYNLELLITDGKTKKTQNILVQHLTRLEMITLTPSATQQYQVNRPLLRSTTELILLLDDGTITVGWNGQKYEATRVRYEPLL